MVLDPSPAQAKPAPVPELFTLASVVALMMDRDNPQTRENAANSLRCLGIEEHFLRNEINVPDDLIVQPMRQAVTLTTNVPGLTQTRVYDDFIQALVGESELLAFANVEGGFTGNIGVPRATTVLDPATPNPEGQAMNTTTLTVERANMSPHETRGLYSFSHATQVLAGNLDTVGLQTAIDAIVDDVETAIWRGTGADGQVAGLESFLTDTSARETSYGRGALGKDDARGLIATFNANKIRRNGRLFVATPNVSAQLTGDDFLWPTPSLYRRMEEYEMIDSVRPSEDMVGGEAVGRLWLLRGADVIVRFYGTATQVVVKRNAHTGDMDVGYARFWDMALRHPESMQVLRATI